MCICLHVCTHALHTYVRSFMFAYVRALRTLKVFRLCCLDPLSQLDYRRQKLEETLVHIRKNFLRRRSLDPADSGSGGEGKVHGTLLIC